MFISFNKGKNYYRIDDEATLNDILEIISKLNQKTWNSIISKMEDKIVEKFGTYEFNWKEINLNGVYVQTDINLNEKLKRLNILRNYLFYYKQVYKVDKFIV